MIRKLVVSVILSILLTLSSLVVRGDVSSPQIDYTPQAETLKSLGLFRGTSNGFELDRNATRVEAAVMLVRLLGKEGEAKEKKYVHPFTDVDEWASDSIGYLYKNGLTKGISETQFGSKQIASPAQYTTFVLRALGYRDENGDFTWDKALDKGLSIGLLLNSEYNRLASLVYIPRNELVLLSYNSLFQRIIGTQTTLLNQLVDQKTISQDQLTVAKNKDRRLLEIVGWELPTDSSSLNADQRMIYNEITDHLMGNYIVRNYYIRTETGYIDIHISDMEPGASNFSLYYYGMPAFDALETISLTANGKIHDVPKGGRQQFYGIAAYNDFKDSKTIEINYNENGSLKKLEIQQSSFSTLSEEQVVLLMSVDPQASSRYISQDPAGFIYSVYQTYAVNSNNYGEKTLWQIEVRTGDGDPYTQRHLYMVYENPSSTFTIK